MSPSRHWRTNKLGSWKRSPSHLTVIRFRAHPHIGKALGPMDQLHGSCDDPGQQTAPWSCAAFHGGLLHCRVVCRRRPIKLCIPNYGVAPCFSTLSSPDQETTGIFLSFLTHVGSQRTLLHGCDCNNMPYVLCTNPTHQPWNKRRGVHLKTVSVVALLRIIHTRYKVDDPISYERLE